MSVRTGSAKLLCVVVLANAAGCNPWYWHSKVFMTPAPTGARFSDKAPQDYQSPPVFVAEPVRIDHGPVHETSK